MNYQNIISKLIRREDLSDDEALESIKSIMNKELSDSQIGGFLVALQQKGVTSNELSSFVKVLREYSIKISPKVNNITDTCGTGGDNSHTFNISTITSIVLAASGLNVAKHGNRAITSRCGSFDVLEKLGINIDLKPEQVQTCIEKIGIGFLYAPNYHPAFRNIANIRKDLGIRTVFNMMGPLLNPANLSNQVIGVYDEPLTELIANTLLNLGMKNAMVVYGYGIDELTLCGKTKITQLKEGIARTFYLEPEDIGLKKCRIEDLASNSIDQSVSIFLDILNNKKSSKLDIVLLNSAAGLVVSGKADNFHDGIEMSSEMISGGLALKKFEEIRNYTNDIAKNNQ